MNNSKNNETQNPGNLDGQPDAQRNGQTNGQPTGQTTGQTNDKWPSLREKSTESLIQIPRTREEAFKDRQASGDSDNDEGFYFPRR
jgi:hypothetical protein